jgi:tRNA-splicing ligase RtcB
MHEFTGNYEIIQSPKGIIKAWIRGVPVEESAIKQLQNVAQMPFIYKWPAAMPDVHWGMGATIGTVLPMKGAIIPSAVGVDIGCGMMAQPLKLLRDDLNFIPLEKIRAIIEKAVPAGRTHDGNRRLDRGGWGKIPQTVQAVWDLRLAQVFNEILEDNPGIKPKNDSNHLATLGTGNHFIELSYDEKGRLWIVLHSGSRGPGNRFGVYFIKLAKELCKKWFIDLPDPDLAYFPESTPEFDRYWKALCWSLKFAELNRELMMENILIALEEVFPGLELAGNAIKCHHNYAARERHFGENIIVTRKGAVRAEVGDMGIIPGSMGARSYIVSGLGNRDSFNSCSHGAGRLMGRKEALRRFTVEDHVKATEGIECAKDASVLDETPGAYKDIDVVMAAQTDLVETVHILKQLVCVKGGKEVEE